MLSLRSLWRSLFPARIPDWEREEGKAPSQIAGLVPLLRRLWRSSSPARIPDWEREEGKAPPQAPGLVPSLRNNTMIRSFHNLFRVEKIAVSTWHLLPEYVLLCYVYHCVFIRYLSIKVPSCPTSSVPPVLRQQGCLLSQPQFLLVL